MIKNHFTIVFLMFLAIYAKGQNSRASIQIEGKTMKRLDKYSKTFKLKKKFDTDILGSVNGVIQDGEQVIKKFKSNESGIYNINFDVLPNKNYTLIFSKIGFFNKKFEFNTNGISNHKTIEFEGWDFHLYKRIIGLSDSIFNIPTKFYYDSQRGYMTYDEAFNTPLDVSQSEFYFDFLNNLNENDYIIEEPIGESYSKEYIKDTSEIKTKTIETNKLPNIHLLNIDEFMNELKISKNEDTIIENKENEISKEWQKLEIAKTKAITIEDKSKILAAEQLLLEKEKQIETAKSEIRNAKKQLKIQAIESENKNTLLALFASILLLALALLFVIFRNNKERIKNNLLLKEKNKEVIDSIKYAQRIQHAILPPLNIINENLKENFILYLPKDIVSGDFYWVKNIGNKTLFAVVDCTGHGVPGAFMSIIAHNALNQAVNQYKLIKPSDILNQVNIDISKTLHQTENIDVEDGMDISLCLLDNSTNKLEFSGAHHSLNLLRNGELKIIKGDKYSIGSIKAKNNKYSNHNFELNSNDYIYIFSDGYADQFGGKKERKFMYKRLRNILTNNADKSLEMQKEILHTELNNWKGNLEQVDDICIMGVKIV